MGQSALGAQVWPPQEMLGIRRLFSKLPMEQHRAGKGIAHSIATLLDAELMLKYLSEEEAGDGIQVAVDRIVEKGKVPPPDMGG